MSWNDYVNAHAPKMPWLDLQPAAPHAVHTPQRTPKAAPSPHAATAIEHAAAQRSHVNDTVRQHSSIPLEPSPSQLQQAGFKNLAQYQASVVSAHRTLGQNRAVDSTEKGTIMHALSAADAPSTQGDLGELTPRQKKAFLLEHKLKATPQQQDRFRRQQASNAMVTQGHEAPVLTVNAKQSWQFLKAEDQGGARAMGDMVNGIGQLVTNTGDTLSKAGTAAKQVATHWPETRAAIAHYADRQIQRAARTGDMTEVGESTGYALTTAATVVAPAQSGTMAQLTKLPGVAALSKLPMMQAVAATASAAANPMTYWAMQMGVSASDFSTATALAAEGVRALPGVAAAERTLQEAPESQVFGVSEAETVPRGLLKDQLLEASRANGPSDVWTHGFEPIRKTPYRLNYETHMEQAREIQFFGAMPHEVQAIQKAYTFLPESVQQQMLPLVREVHLVNANHLQNMAGFAVPEEGVIVLNRAGMANIVGPASALDRTAMHESFHLLDFGKGQGGYYMSEVYSQGENPLFGELPFPTQYAPTNTLEDAAETGTELYQLRRNVFEAGMGDGEFFKLAYEHPTLGPKYRPGLTHLLEPHQGRVPSDAYIQSLIDKTSMTPQEIFRAIKDSEHQKMSPYFWSPLESWK